MTMQTPAAPTPALSVPGEGGIVRDYDIQSDRETYARSLAGSPEIDALTSTIDVSDMTSIVTFGAGAAAEISKASDVVLRTMSMSELDESSSLLTTLAGIMAKFDMEEVKPKTGLMSRLFGNARKQLDRIMGKYQTLGDEVDKVYVRLRQYEEEIRRSNTQLDQLFEANVGYYHELVKYIEAGDQGVREIEAYLVQREEDQRRSGDPALQFELQTLRQARDMLRQRVQDLRVAEVVAMQSIPMIRTMQYNNMSLVRQINSAFITTLPVFKQSLAQAILLRRQQVQAEALGALRNQTNELLRRNARSAAEVSRLTAQLQTEGAGPTADTLESSWHTIMTGIDDTRRLQATAQQQREEDQAKLDRIRADFRQRFPQGT